MSPRRNAWNMFTGNQCVVETDNLNLLLFCKHEIKLTCNNLTQVEWWCIWIVFLIQADSFINLGMGLPSKRQ